MKIIYTGLHYTNYSQLLGKSFEYNNFYKTFKRFLDSEIIPIWYDDILKKGKKQWNNDLFELIKKEQPDIFFAFMFTDELDFEILEKIKKYTKSIAWFSDDHWRFDNYSKYYAPYFSHIITTYSMAVNWYKKIGIQNVISSQWGVNIDIYKPVKWTGVDDDAPDVSFVGSWSRPRANIINKLKKEGISVSVYGNGWDNGRINQGKMIEMFSNSKINLGLNPAPGFLNINSLGRIFFRRSINKIVPDFHIIRNFKSLFHRNIPQIKARHFEIPACGGFLITQDTDDLENYYKNGEEVVIYKDIDDLIKKIKYYLVHNEEREKIAWAGYKRTIKDHTYQKRFEKIFETIKKGTL